MLVAHLISLQGFQDTYVPASEELLELHTEWCVRDKSLWSFARKKHKRKAHVGEKDTFEGLPDAKKDLCLKLKLGEQTVILGLRVNLPGGDVQRSLCRLGNRTYHVTYVLRHPTEEETAASAAENLQQQQQQQQQYSSSSSLPRTSQPSASLKRGSWIQSLLPSNQNKCDKRDANEEERPAKKRALLPSWLRFSKLSSRAADRAPDSPKQSSMHRPQHVDVQASTNAATAAAASSRLTSHLLVVPANAHSASGSRPSSNNSQVKYETPAAHTALQQHQMSDQPLLRSQQVTAPKIAISQSPAEGLPAQPPKRPASVSMPSHLVGKFGQGTASAGNGSINPLYDTTSSPGTSDASPAPTPGAPTSHVASRRGFHLHSLSAVPYPSHQPNQVPNRASLATGGLPLQSPEGDAAAGVSGKGGLDSDSGTQQHHRGGAGPGAAAAQGPRQDLGQGDRQQQAAAHGEQQHVHGDAPQQQQQQQQQQQGQGLPASGQGAARQQQQRDRKAEGPKPQTPPSPPPPLSAALVADAKQAHKLLEQVGPTLAANKYSEYDDVLQGLIQRRSVIEEGIARGLLNSVLQEITPYDRGTPVPGLPGRFTKVITLKHEQQKPQQPSHSRSQSHSQLLFNMPQQQQVPAKPQHKRSQSQQEPNFQQQKSQGQLPPSPSSQPHAQPRHLRTTSLNVLQKLQRQLSEVTKIDKKPATGAKEKKQETLMLTLQYADADQVSVGAPTSCTCIAVAAAAWYEESGSAARLDPAAYNQLIRRGAEAWFHLCQDVDAQSHLLDFVSVFEYLKKQQGWKCHHEVVEAYCQIGAGGSGDGSTTFEQFVDGCMREPGAYILTVANHCTVAATRHDGTVEWANSLGRCLEPGCQLGYIAEFSSLEAFSAAYVAAHRPIQGVVQVEAHRVGATAPQEGQRFEMYSN